MSDSENFNGCPAKQEVALEARDAPLARFPGRTGYRGRTAVGGNSPASPYQPQRLLSGSQGRQDQGRRGLIPPPSGRQRPPIRRACPVRYAQAPAFFRALSCASSWAVPFALDRTVFRAIPVAPGFGGHLCGGHLCMLRKPDGSRRPSGCVRSQQGRAGDDRSMPESVRGTRAALESWAGRVAPARRALPASALTGAIDPFSAGKPSA